jgi:hypothetical protein
MHVILGESELQAGPSSFWLISLGGDEYDEMAVDGSTMGSAFQYPSPPNSIAPSSSIHPSIHPLKPKCSTFEGKIIQNHYCVKTTYLLKMVTFV